MARVIGDALVQVRPETRGFASAAGKGITNGLGKVGSVAAGAVKKTFVAGSVVTGATAGLVLSKGFDRALKIEGARAKLRGLGHDATGVDKVMKSALKSVRGTAYGLDTAATTAAGAVAAGIKPGKQLTGYLKTVADTATIAGTSMDEMGSIINKTTTSGKVFTDNLNQLADRGIPVFQWLAKEYGVSQSALSEMVTKGEVDAKTFRKVLRENIGGAALESGQTTQGAFANLNASLGRIGENLLSGVFPKLQPLLAGLTKQLEPLEGRAKEVGAAVGRMVERFTPQVVDWVRGLAQSMSGLASKKSDPSSLLGRVSTAVKGIDWSSVRASTSDVGQSLRDLGPFFQDLLRSLPGVADVTKVFATTLRFAADHVDTLRKLLPYLIGGYVAYKVAQAASNVAALVGVGVRVAEVSATRAHTKAMVQQTATMAVSTTAANLDNTTRKRGIAIKVAEAARTVAVAVAQRVAAAATRVWAAGQWVLNAAMRANPIGIVITALVALGAGLVLAYKKSETFRNIVNGAWTGIKNGLATAWGYVAPVLRSIGNWLAQVLPRAFSMFRTVATTVFRAAGTVVSTWWNGYAKPIFNGIRTVLTGVVFPVIRALYSGVVKPVFSRVGSTISAVWKGAIQPTFSAIKGGVRGVRDVISTVVGAIGRAWDGIREAFRAPVAWVVDNVINRLISAVNTVAKALGKNGNLISPVVFGSGGGGSKPKGPNKTVIRRRFGGPIPGSSPSPTADNIPMMGTAGEWVHRVAAVKKYGARFMEAVNAGRFPLALARAPRGLAAAAAKGGTDLLYRAKGGPVTVKPLAGGVPSTYPGHTGVDFNAPNDFGKPILAARAGRVAAVKRMATSYGQHVWVRHAGGVQTISAHMSKILAKVGQTVRAGTMIGRVGSTGNSSGPHLHFETRPGGTYQAAMAFLRGAKTIGGDGAGPGINPLAMLKSKLAAIRKATAGLAGMGPLGKIGGLVRDRLSAAALDQVRTGAKAAGKTGLFGLAGLVASQVFDRGGLARGKGTIAKNTVKPERILSPKQTELFDRLVAALNTRRLAALEDLAKTQARERRQLISSRRYRAMDAEGRRNALTDLAERQKKKRGDLDRSLKSEQRTQLAATLNAGVQLGKVLSNGFAKGLAGNREQVAARFEPVMELVAKIGDKKLTALATRTRTQVLGVAADYEKAVAATGAARERLNALRETATGYAADLAKNGVDSADITGSADTTLRGITGYLKDAITRVSSRNDLTASLSKAGLSPTAIAQIVAEGGTRSTSIADSILAGGPAAIKKVNDLMAQLETTSTTYGRTASAAVYGAQLRASEATVAALKAAEAPLVQQMTDLGRAMTRALAAQLPTGKAVTKKNLAALLAGSTKVRAAASKSKARKITRSATFDDGGIARGFGDMPKATLRPERVLSGSQTEAFEDWMRHGASGAGGRPIEITQNFPTTATPRAAAAAAGARTVDALAAVGVVRKP